MQIHVDRYKHIVHSRLSDSFMQAIVTLNPIESRLHACERFQRCADASSDYRSPHLSDNADATSETAPEILQNKKPDRKVVYVSPVTIGRVKWAQHTEDTKHKIESGENVTCLVRSLCLFVCLQSCQPT